MIEDVCAVNVWELLNDDTHQTSRLVKIYEYIIILGKLCNVTIFPAYNCAGVMCDKSCPKS